MKVERVVADVWRIDLGMVNAYLCADGERLTLIDTGLSTSAEDISAAIAETGHRIEQLAQIVLTHFHDDHRGSASRFRMPPAVRVLAHAADAPVIRGLAPQPPPDFTDWERKLHEQIAGDEPLAPDCEVDVELADGDAIELGGVATIVGVPGHTPGSIAVLVPERGLLLTGDAVATFKGEPIVGVFNIDRVAALASFVKVAGLEFETLCVGHGDPIASGAASRIRAVAQRLEAA